MPKETPSRTAVLPGQGKRHQPAAEQPSTNLQNVLQSMLTTPESLTYGQVAQLQSLLGNRELALLLAAGRGAGRNAERRPLAGAALAAPAQRKPIQMKKEWVRVDDDLLDFLQRLIAAEFIKPEKETQPKGESMQEEAETAAFQITDEVLLRLFSATEENRREDSGTEENRVEESANTAADGGSLKRKRGSDSETQGENYGEPQDEKGDNPRHTKKKRIEYRKAQLPDGEIGSKPLMPDKDYDQTKLLKLMRDIFQKAMEEFLDEQVPVPESINSALGAIKTLWEYQKLHADSDKPPKNISRYTRNSKLAFFNLGESILPGGTYDDIRANLLAVFGELKKANQAGHLLLRLVAAPSFAVFTDIVNDIPETEVSAEEREQIRTVGWQMNQLWRLEAGRRLAGGAINTVLLEKALTRKDISVKEAVEALTVKNVMNFEGASGKSDGYQFLYGKQYKLVASQTIINELMIDASGHEVLVGLRDSLDVFYNKLRDKNKPVSAMDDETISSGGAEPDEQVGSMSPVEIARELGGDWEKAATKTYEKKGARQFALEQRGDREEMDRHVSRRLADNPYLNAIFAWPEFKAVERMFEKLMRVHYGMNASESKPMDLSETGQDKPKHAKRPIKFNEFETWLIDKAAAQGHLRVLEDEMLKDETFLEMFEANADPNKATAVKHVANLRKGLELTSDPYHPFYKLVIDSERASTIYDKDFGEYRDIASDVFHPIGHLFKTGKNLLQEQVKALKVLKAAEEEGEPVTVEQQKITNLAKNKKAGENSLAFMADLSFGEVESMKQLLEHLADFEQLADAVESISNRKASSLENDYYKPLAAYRSAIDRLGGLKRVYHIVETVRSFPMGILNMMVNQATNLSPSDKFKNYNAMSDKGAATDEKLQNKKVISILKKVTWTEKKPMHYLINAILQQLAALSQEEEEGITEENKDRLTAMVKTFLSMAYEPDSLIEFDREELENNGPEANVRFYFKVLTTRMKQQLEAGNLSSFNELLNKFYDQAQALADKPYFEPIYNESVANVHALIARAAKSNQTRAIYGGGGFHGSFGTEPKDAVDSSFSMNTKGALPTDAFLKWETVGDNNCAFNGFGLSLIGLIRQGCLSEPYVLERLNYYIPNAISADELTKLVSEYGEEAIDQHLRTASRGLQQRFEPVIRQLAVGALRRNDGLIESIRLDLLATLENKVRSGLGLIPQGASGDLFRDPNSPGVQRLEEVTLDALNEFMEREEALSDPPPQSLDERLKDFLNEKKQALSVWFIEVGKEMYLGHMEQEYTWGGAPELQALARHFGIHLAISTPFGLDMGGGEAGSAAVNYTFTDGDGQGHTVNNGAEVAFTEEEIGLLRSDAANVIEGVPMDTENPRIYFRLMDRGQVQEALNNLPEDLKRRFLTLYDRYYRYRITGKTADIRVREEHEMILDEQEGERAAFFTAAELQTLIQRGLIDDPGANPERITFRAADPGTIMNLLQDNERLRDKFLEVYNASQPRPIVAGMMNRNSVHWSAFTTDKGAFNLMDAEEFIQHGEWRESGFVMSGSSVKKQASTASKAAPYTGELYKRQPIPNIVTVFSDSLFGTVEQVAIPFSLTDIDPSLKPDTDRVGLVNAANASLKGGGGIDGAIHEVAGAGITDEAQAWLQDEGNSKYWDKGQGKAMSTTGGQLTGDGIHRIIHTVGPDNRLGQPLTVLEDCVRSVLQEAANHKLTAIIFCNISSGIYGFNENETAIAIHQAVDKILNSEMSGYRPKIIFNNFP
ncbi:macro domain-containing protein [Paenibacillus hamazuiensis]|uniref:macro domain-containing protein n=1 Tax=Paenibacillus hamazuiensis TaxID=2936508 RepID=UPI00200F67D8|nr:macro domain-containing protein [Paenibacillus hamazuiensis]